MLTRRRFLQGTIVLAGGSIVPATSYAGCTTKDWFMPDEGAPHQRTWMAWGAGADIWGWDLLPAVRRSLATLARTIAKYEPVSMLVREQEYAIARELVGDEIQLFVCPLDDLWIRDTGPVFVITEPGEMAAVDFNFNGWGGKQEHRRDAGVAAFVASQAGVTIIGTPLVMEGGGIEVDGHGTAIITESCTLNGNRNPGMSKSRFEDLLMPLLGLDKIIWLPGITGKDITDGHTDFYARFARPGVVLAGYDPDPDSFDHEVTKRHLEILEAATDAQGDKLEVIPLEAPASIREDDATKEFAAGYIGYYVCNDAVIMQEFGDARTDNVAKAAMQKVFPKRTIEQINSDGIAAGGGSIHCATLQELLA